MCLACHGPEGQSLTPGTPSLGGQPSFFVIAQLFLFRRGGRASAPMTEAAKSLSADQRKQINADIATLQALRVKYARAPTPVTTAGPPPYVPGRAGVAVNFAYAQLGKPYAWAAAGPNSYDCSGLTMAA